MIWDVENRLTAVSGGASYVYDGDGNRVKKTDGGATILYVNKYYEKDLTTGVATTYYYLGDKLVFKRTPQTQEYVHQDSLGSTVLTTDTQGQTVGSLTSYYPYGGYRAGVLPNMDIMFTGQRNDGGGLYYYGNPDSDYEDPAMDRYSAALTVSTLWSGRYYDSSIGRFISPDTIVPDYKNPQALNRFSYVLNNPLRFTDPTGHFLNFFGNLAGALIGAVTYIAVRMATNLFLHSQGNFSQRWSHAFDNWDWGKFGLVTAVGALTYGIGSLAMAQVVAGTMTASEATVVTVCAASASASILYQSDLRTSDIKPSPESALTYLDLQLVSVTAGEINAALPLVTDPILGVAVETGRENKETLQKTTTPPLFPSKTDSYGKRRSSGMQFE